MVLRFEVIVDWSRCNASEICVTICPTYVFEIRKIIIGGKAKKVSYVVDESKCIGCFGCMVTCPNQAIVVKPKDLNRISKIKQKTLI